jgi:hypothetical protein
VGVDTRDALSRERMLKIGGESKLGPGRRTGQAHDKRKTERIRIAGDDVGKGALDRRFARLVWRGPDLQDSAKRRLADLCPETPPDSIGSIAHGDRKYAADEVASGVLRQRDSAEIVIGLGVLSLGIGAEANVRFRTTERRIERLVLSPAL